jgi:putative ABC transport system ATP-binding protein
MSCSGGHFFNHWEVEQRSAPFDGEVMTETANPCRVLLQIQDLTKSYRLGSNVVSVLRGLSLEVAMGEMVVIMGPSGSGKTTLLNCVAGIDVPDGGQVALDGHVMDLASESARTRLRRRRIGMVFQFFNLIPTLTVRENVALPFFIAGEHDRAADKRVEQLLVEVGMERQQDHYPFQLSGGEMQLTSIARALAHRPGLLLADEPTGNVNPQVGRTIMEILCATAAREGAAVLMVTHSPEHAAWSDRVCFLKDGIIAAEHLQKRQRDEVARIHKRLVELEI